RARGRAVVLRRRGRRLRLAHGETPEKLPFRHRPTFRGRAMLAAPQRRQHECMYRNLYTESMKTTLDLDDELLANAKALAAQQRTSLTRLIEEGLQLRLRAVTAEPP